MIRIIIIAIVVYVFYRALKSWMFANPDPSKSVTDKEVREIDDVMIKDPLCEAYFPKRNAVHYNDNGEDLYFCSIQCRDRFIQTRAGKKAD